MGFLKELVGLLETFVIMDGVNRIVEDRGLTKVISEEESFSNVHQICLWWTFSLRFPGFGLLFEGFQGSQDFETRRDIWVPATC